jgi:uncharacterized membrane protein YdjX (TVP38/TMEM64 family)
MPTILAFGLLHRPHQCPSTRTISRIIVGSSTTNRRRQTPLNANNHRNDDDNNKKINSKEDEDREEEARLRILQSRRRQIRQTLRAAEATRTVRIERNWVPELDPVSGKPVAASDAGRSAVTITAFCVTAGAIALRVGGRAALVSATGLDFLTTSPEVRDNLDAVLSAAETMDPVTMMLLFSLAWTAVKVLCFDAGGVVLALASGILFGGVLRGALASATAATLGSTVAFYVAKADTPLRTKALALLDEYPSLRGIEKVVARDGLKAVLTLRLAPVLPIPIGFYNYIYGVTNVPVGDFVGGIFLGSIKPYLLDSYLGYFGKEVIQGTSEAGGIQDFLLLGALGVSVLIGVFASQLAAETWDSVLEEVEAEKKAKAGNADAEGKNGIVREIFGLELPQWMVGFQLQMKGSDERISNLILDEFDARVWNYTSDKDVAVPAERDPANTVTSPELLYANQGVDLAAAICDGLVLTPLLVGAFVKYSDPLYKEEADELVQDRRQRRLADGRAETEETARQELLNRLDRSKEIALKRISELDERIKNLSK